MQIRIYIYNRKPSYHSIGTHVDHREIVVVSNAVEIGRLTIRPLPAVTSRIVPRPVPTGRFRAVLKQW